MIVHITERQQWEVAQCFGEYRCDSLEREGFIHCSRPEQVISVTNRFFPGQTELVLLCIDPERVQSPIKYEAADDDVFPHIYGSLNLDAVFKVIDFSPSFNGKFETLPEILIP